MAALALLMRMNTLLCRRRIGYAKMYGTEASAEEEEFRVFNLRNYTKKDVSDNEKYVKLPPSPARELQMSTNQDWSNVWPGPRSFHPASVPLPLKQGFDRKQKRPPSGKYANAELMKLPNFLHLTPPAIKKHCEILRRFCTSWPINLQTCEEIDENFPLKVITTDYCHSSPKIRDPKARVVTFQFKLCKLPLDSHSKDKIQRLLGERYNSDDGIVTLVTDRCPLRKHNYDYNQYLLLALYYESWKTENWESEKTEQDMEYYDWDKNLSKKSYISLKTWPNGIIEENQLESSLLADTDLAEYKQSVSVLFNQGESTNNIFKYKEAVLKIVM